MFVNSFSPSRLVQADAPGRLVEGFLPLCGRGGHQVDVEVATFRMPRWTPWQCLGSRPGGVAVRLSLFIGRVLGALGFVGIAYLFRVYKLFTAILAIIIDRSESSNYLPPSAARHGLQFLVIYGLCAVFRLSVRRLGCARLPCRLRGQVFVEAVFTPPYIVLIYYLSCLFSF